MRTNLKYDLEDRSMKFAQAIRSYIRTIKNKSEIQSDVHQLIRSSGSVGANYIEANDALSKKDFLMRIRICLKETKETEYWLKLIHETYPDSDKLRMSELIKEAHELRCIFAKIIQTTLNKTSS